MRLLRLGSMGPSVQLLQLALNRAGFGPLEQDGVFGTATQNALTRFQQAQGLTPDGIAGSSTQSASALVHRLYGTSGTTGRQSLFRR